jgi:ATP-dependent Clp protease ATP-binding subunit ClpA
VAWRLFNGPRVIPITDSTPDLESKMTRGNRITRKIRLRWATASALSLSLLAGMVFSHGTKAQIGQRQAPVVNPILAKYVTDLTTAAERGKFASLEVNSKNTERAIDILASHQKNNPVVISESQTVRDMVMIGVATRIATADIPEELKNSRLYKLKLDAIFHDARTPSGTVEHDLCDPR